jgi:hypothetical protein
MAASNTDSPPPAYQPAAQPTKPPHRPRRNWKADIETGFSACCSKKTQKHILFFILAIIVNAAIAGIYVGLIALYEHFRFTNPYGVGPGEVLPGALTTAILLLFGGLGLCVCSGGVTFFLFDHEEYCAGVMSALATLFFVGVWIFNCFEGWKYNLLNMK